MPIEIMTKFFITCIALNSQEDGFGLDAAGVCISDAQRALARLTGEDATEATIDEVFSTFCVGK